MTKYNSFWIEQEKKFIKAIDNIVIPNHKLEKVDYIDIKETNDLSNIPNGGGCYWIWTDEPVVHTLHKNGLPDKINNGEIIYNGIAKDDVKGRVFHHLFGFEDAGWSGISMDIYKNRSVSHRKKAMSSKGKVSFVLGEKTYKRNTKKYQKGDKIVAYKKIINKEQLLTLHLSEEEKTYIKNTDLDVYHFRNGINVKEDKHKSFNFRVYFITGLTSLYLELIEKRWRENGLPRLCSYSTGR